MNKTYLISNKANVMIAHAMASKNVFDVRLTVSEQTAEHIHNP